MRRVGWEHTLPRVGRVVDETRGARMLPTSNCHDTLIPLPVYRSAWHIPPFGLLVLWELFRSVGHKEELSGCGYSSQKGYFVGTPTVGSQADFGRFTSNSLKTLKRCLFKHLGPKSLMRQHIGDGQFNSRSTVGMGDQRYSNSETTAIPPFVSFFFHTTSREGSHEGCTTEMYGVRPRFKNEWPASYIEPASDHKTKIMPQDRSHSIKLDRSAAECLPIRELLGGVGRPTHHVRFILGGQMKRSVLLEIGSAIYNQFKLQVTSNRYHASWITQEIYPSGGVVRKARVQQLILGHGSSHQG
ncbi:hypothetical protein C8R43DRAFT_952940 [Mycena crocata]|nr:hypothetical protein C8R43DRAFT_952940 [Mycena crocata]